MRTILTWLGIGSAVLAVYIAKTVFHFSDIQIGLAGLVILVIVLAHQVNALKEERPRFKKKFVDKLLHSEPIKVKHDPPKNLTPDGMETWPDKGDFECFSTLWFFGEAANKDLEDDPWRLQELAITDISGVVLAMDEPAFGRRYEIFYNQLKVGLLQIKASASYDEDKSIFAEIAITHVPVTALPSSEVTGFLGTIAGLLTSEKRPKGGGETEHEKAVAIIQSEMINALWTTANDFTLSEQCTWAADFSVLLPGTPERYYRLEHRARAARKEAVPA